MVQDIRIGLIGAGGNTRLRHIPGLLAVPGVTLAGVCNRRPESTQAVAREFGIAKTYERWEDLIADPRIDAVVIGTWPYLHCPITLAALQAGKHVLTEARLSMNADEARRMLAASRQFPKLVTQVVPSPFGLKGHAVMTELLAAGYIGDLREVRVCNLNGALADPQAALTWRQDAELSGCNVLTLGIVYETLLRWVPPVASLVAQSCAHIPTRIDPATGTVRQVGTPDSVQVSARLASGPCATFHFSGAVAFGQSASIDLFGTKGALHYDLLTDRVLGGQAVRLSDLAEIPIPPEKARSWNVEADFIAAIREQKPIEFTTFEAGVAYMEFTEAVARSAETGQRVQLRG